MIRIAICCGGGFSSSALAAHLEKETAEKNLGERASFVFIPIGRLIQRMNEVDVALVCPHMEWKVRGDAPKYTIPVSIIPPRLYGLMSATDFIEDAEDIRAMWEKGTDSNYVRFPDEPRPLAVKRAVSHRKMLRGEVRDFSAK